MTQTEIIQRVNQQLNNKEYLIIDSSKRISGVAENFQFQLPKLIKNIKSIKPIYIIISNNIYNITNSNNLMAIIRNGNVIIIGIQPGTYNETQLISALNAAWLGQNLTFGYDPLTLKITITDTTPIPIQLDNINSTILHVIGFDELYNYQLLQLQHVSNRVVQLSNIYDFININIDIVQQIYGSVNTNYLVSFPISDIPFGKSSMIQFPNIEIISKKSFFQSFNVKLTDKTFTQIDNNNSDFLLLLEINFLK